MDTLEKIIDICICAVLSLYIALETKSRTEWDAFKNVKPL